MAARKKPMGVSTSPRRKGPARHRKRLACIFAHPDDETFAMGGVLARYAAEGVETTLFCATNGDAGKNSDVPVSSREELGGLRRNELIAAARFLGVRDLELPGYPDGALATVDPDELTGRIVLALRRWRPQVVVTFGPEGAPNDHRDHRAICRAATAAFFLAGVRTAFPEQLDEVMPHRPSRLFYAAWKGYATGKREMLSVPPTAKVDVHQHLKDQMAAFLLHATQRTHLEMFRSIALLRYEYFALAAGEPQPTAMVEDLFDGLR